MKSFNEFRDLVKTNSKEIHENTLKRVDEAFSDMDLNKNLGDVAVWQRVFAKYQTLELLELYHNWLSEE